MAAILVTGASTGIGEACALHLDRAGHRVFAGVRRPADGERLTKRASPRLLPVMLDVCDDSQIAEAAELIGGEVGTAGLWGLVNNAGIAIGGPVEFLALDQWRTQLEVNVIGQVAVTRAMLPLVRAATGRVVFIGSISGRLATPMMGPYCASKHAIEAIGSSLAEELRPFGIRVSVIEPGAIATPIWDKGRELADDLQAALPPEAHEHYGRNIARIRKLIDRQQKTGIDPIAVAAVVERALFDRRPRRRYLVGTDAKVGAVLARLLPDRPLAAVLRRLAP